MSGNIGEGIQYELIFDTTTYSTHRRNHILTYTGVDLTCETDNAGATHTLALGLSFAGVAFIDFPYVEMSAALTSPYDGQNLSVPYGGGDSLPDTEAGKSTSNMITVLHRCRTYCIPAETVTAGNPVFRAEVADHASDDTHDGMIGVADVAEQDEVDSIFGIAETGFTVPGTHANHDSYWNQDAGQYDTVHEAVWVTLWR